MKMSLGSIPREFYKMVIKAGSREQSWQCLLEEGGNQLPVSVGTLPPQKVRRAPSTCPAVLESWSSLNTWSCPPIRLFCPPFYPHWLNFSDINMNSGANLAFRAEQVKILPGPSYIAESVSNLEVRPWQWCGIFEKPDTTIRGGKSHTVGP
jgi:hypothetical protein